MIQYPCKDCKIRYVGCHAKCSDYKAAAEQNRKIQEARYKRIDEDRFYRTVHSHNNPKGRWR
jgi:hypothetical protein